MSNNSPSNSEYRTGAGDSYEDLYEHAPCGHLSTTVDGIILRVNETLLRWTGYRREKLLGQPFVSFLQPGSQLVFETRYLSVLHLRGEVREVAMTFRHTNGTAVPMMVNGTVTTNEKGEPATLRMAVFDASERREYERELLASQRRAEASEARVRVLQNASSAFTEATTDTALADELTKITRDAFAACRVSLYLLNKEGKLDLASGEPALGLPDLSAEGPAKDLARTDYTMILSRTDATIRSSRLGGLMRSARVETLVAVPLSDESTPLGVLISSFERPRSFGPDDIELYEALTRQAAQVLTRIHLHQQLERLALIDQLTGVASRRLIEHRLNDAVNRSQLHQRPMALLFIDLDGFKTINDELGHATGDSVLSEIGSRLSLAVRRGDLVGRLGGDEFVILCEDAAPEEVDRVIQRLHAALRTPLTGRASQTRVTGSIGTVLYPDGVPDHIVPNLILEQADQAMYRSKRAGKNQDTTIIIEDNQHETLTTRRGT